MEPLSKTDYAQGHAQFLPTGLAWPRRGNSVLMRLLSGLSSGYSAIDRCLIRLTRELDPRSTSILLDDWERFAGLPDACSLDGATESERRAAVVAKIAATGGASADYFIAIAAALGYRGATVTESQVARYGRARFGERYQGIAWRHVWHMNIPVQGSTPARFTDRYGIRYRQSSNTVLECRIVKLKPSHTKVIFHYGA